MDLPTYIQLEPVGQCNLKCQMCAIQFRADGTPHGPPAFMAWDLFVRILDDLPTLTELHLQGLGEPMMHPRFFDMVAYAAARGIVVSTNSNVTLLTRRRADRCVTSGLTTLHVSVDGATEATYEGIRVGASFARVRRNLGHLRDTKRAMSSEKPRVRLVMVLMRRNLRELPAVVRLAAEHDIDTVFVQHLCHDFTESTLPARYAPMREFVHGENLTGCDEELTGGVFAEARQTAESLGIELRLPRLDVHEHAPGTPGRERCDWPWHGPYITYRGDAMPCCMISTPDRGTLGTVAEQPISQIWRGAAYESFRAALASDGPPAICRGCSVYRGTF
ncbi:MAG TPA: radical SAM protein [Gemmatimonadaceae bacterium]|nr:radical SAM protein [Gemmatimonadaceae bacterium]